MAKKLMMMVVAALAAAFGAWADTWTDPDTGYTWTYRINGDTAEIFKGSLDPAISPSPTGAVTIPATLGGKPVTSIGDWAFAECSGLTSVTIPDSVTSIGSDAFYGCSGLTSVTIPDSVTSIGSSAFRGCSGLTSVTIPDSVTRIGGYAFAYCSGLTSVTIGNGVTSIGQDAFSGCSGLASVTIPDSVTSIGYHAFFSCSGLTSVTIPDSVTSIGQDAFSGCSEDLYDTTTIPGVKIVDNWVVGYTDALSGDLDLMGIRGIGNSAFSGCSGLTSVKIPDGVTSIGYSAFSGCSRLTSVSIPDSVTSIGSSAFSGCSGLTSVTIPDSVTSIGSSAFSGCSGLTSVTIPDSVTSIGEDAFYGCSGLTSVHISDLAKWCGISFGGSYANPLYYAHNLYLNGEKVADLVIPDGVTSIGSYAFYGCSRLTSVTIPDSVTSIGYRAFSGCSGLTSVTIPDSVTSIGSSAFWGCSDSLYDTMTIPGVMLVDGWAVGHTDSLSGNLDLTGVRGVGHYAFESCSGLSSVTIPDGFTSIGNGVFLECSSLTSVTIPNSVTSIGVYAFRGCSGLTSVTIGNGVTSIEDWAFYGCSGLTSVSIPDSVTSIGYMAFYGCRGLTSVTIPDSVTSIGECSFGWCGNLHEILLPENLKGVDIGQTSASVFYYGKFTRIKSERLSTEDSGAFSVETIATNDCRVTFEWKCSCEPMRKGKMYDYLSFSIDGEQKAAICGETGWTQKVYMVEGSGEHVLKWTYQKDASGSEGEDCGWLRLVSVAPPVTLSFLPGGATAGEVPPAMPLYADDEPVTLPSKGTLAWPKHNFRGWSDGETTFVPGTQYPCDADVTTLVAMWERNELVAPTIDAPMMFYQGETATITISAETGATICYTLDGSTPTAESLHYVGPFSVSETTTVRAIAVKDDYFDSEEATLTVTKDTYGDAVNAPMLAFSSDDGTGWRIVCGESPDGLALRSGPISHNATSRLETVVMGEGVVTFSFKVAGEIVKGDVYDGLAFLIDGVQQGELMGDTEWTTNTYSVVGEGMHTLSWLYVKDEGDDEPVVGDCAWLDEVVWASTRVVTVTFDANGGELAVLDSSRGVMVSTAIGELPLPLYAGYTFLGWFTAAEGGERVTAETVMSDDTTLYAQWIVNVSLGTWTSDFALAKEYADINAIPMLVYWTNQGCHYCQTLEKNVFESEQFASWSQERQFVMVYSQGDSTVKQFAANPSRAFPYVAVYWNKGNGEDALLVKFTGRNGMMPWKWGTLAEQFINSVDSVLGNKEIPDFIVDDGVLIYVSPSLTEFEIPTDVVEIGYKAFDGCTSLANVVIPVGVNQIGSSAFRGCSGLTSVTIPNSVTSIGDYSFYGCSRLTSVTIPDSVTNIGYSAFSGCSGLTNITIGSGVTNIGNYAFYNCSELTSVTIPDNVTSIGYSAFSGCKGLAHVMLGSGVISIGEEAFSGCVGVQDFIVDASNRSYKAFNGFLLTADGNSILYAPEGRSDIVIPDGVTRIGAYSFADRENLTSVTMPDTVTVIEDGAFRDCHSLTNVVLSANLKSLGYTPEGWDSNGVFEGCSGLRSIVLPDGVVNIGYGTFNGCENLASIIIPDSVTSIGSYAFEGCSGLVSVTIGNGVTSIGSAAFSGCSGLTSVTIPNSVKSIRDYTFSDCISLASVTIGGGVTSIGEGAFEGCSDSLFDTTTMPGVKLVDGWAVGHTDSLSGNLDLTGVRGVGPYAFACCSGLTSVTIPDGFTSIGNGVFLECSSLTSVTIPDSVTSIGDEAFSSCSDSLYDTMTIPGVMLVDGWAVGHTDSLPDNLDLAGARGIGPYAFEGCCQLKVVKIPASVVSIGAGAFSECGGVQDFIVDVSNRSYKSSNGFLLEADGTSILYIPEGRADIVIPDGVTRIGRYSFAFRENLTSVTIPDSVTIIEDGAFCECYSLTNVVLSANLKSLGYTPEGWDSNGVFEGCSGLRSIVLPDGVVSIGYGSFSGCENLASITIPDSVTSIGSYAFEGCSGLVSVTIGNGVTSIGEGSFYCGESLASIVFEGNAPNGVDDAFDSDSSCTVYVPRGSTGWGIEIPGIWNGMRIEYAEDVSPDIWTVTFDANRGELAVGDSSRQVEDGTSLGELPVPSRLDYTFLGWFTAAEGGERVTVETTISADITLYAQWRCLFEGAWTQGTDGVWSSGIIGNKQSSALTTVVHGGGTVSFWCMVSSEVDDEDGEVYDGLSFLVDGVNMIPGMIGGEIAWTNLSFSVEGDGSHTLEWKYSKDKSGSAGEDCARMRGFSWMSSAVAYASVKVNGVAVSFETAADGKTRTATVEEGTAAEDVKVVVGGVDVTKGFKIEVAGTTATVSLMNPFEMPREETGSESDANSAWEDNGDGTVTLNIEVVPGLYYAAASSATLETLKCPGAVEPATSNEALTVTKQDGSQGFYKVWVSDSPIKAE